MNVFTTDAYLESIGELFHSGRRRSIEVCQVRGVLLRLLVLDGRTVVRQAPFYDYPQPLETSGSEPVRQLSYFPRTVVETTLVEERRPGMSPSPYIDWSRFSDRAAFDKHVAARKAVRSFGDSARQRRKAERELGPVVFHLDDSRPEVFEACVRWKSEQYRASGLGDMFARAENVELFRRLRQRGVVVLNSLWAGSTLLAAHLAAYHQRRFAWWVPAYDSALGKYSPGRLLLEEAIAASQSRGDVEFDFLIGDEDYKFIYATHNRAIGPVGEPPLGEILMAQAKRRAKEVLARYPRLDRWARQVKRRLEG